ncbi:hypothetical protein ACN42_g7761 [Penicillium freii]|uniref:Uncharacterized protein n=1 Tax=Penicillium freii TaxID=48697 RepID=A0A101MEZ9_PENFR|nr:hypothetical protein ACN42_g7761 [Penicillium freii]
MEMDVAESIQVSVPDLVGDDPKCPTLADQRQNIELVMFHFSSIDFHFIIQPIAFTFSSLVPFSLRANSIESRKRGKSLNVGAESVNPTTY